MIKACSHFTESDLDTKPNTDGCEECLATGDSWVSLRKCLNCGHVGCCNSSKNKHAQKHFEATSHPIVEYFPDPDWCWCYIDNRVVWANQARVVKALQVLPGVGPSIAKDLLDLGVVEPIIMTFMDPQKLYDDLQKMRGAKIDPCVLYVFRAAKYSQATKDPDPKLLKWENWKNREI